MRRPEKIYLDIDGVILGTCSPPEEVEALLRFLLDRFPGRLYWLTTHVRGGENRAGDWLRGKLPDPLTDRLAAEVLPTDWNTLKTEALDFSVPFLWLEDAPLWSEGEALRRHRAGDRLLRMDPRDPASARRALALLRQAAAE